MVFIWWEEHCGWSVLPPDWSLDRGNRTHRWNETHHKLLLQCGRSESHSFLQVIQFSHLHVTWEFCSACADKSLNIVHVYIIKMPARISFRVFSDPSQSIKMNKLSDMLKKYLIVFCCNFLCLYILYITAAVSSEKKPLIHKLPKYLVACSKYK